MDRADHKIVVDAHDDPAVAGVSCVSRAKTGGIRGRLGLGEDGPKAAIACKQVGRSASTSPCPSEGDMFTEAHPLVFETLHVVRMVDPKRNALVYLTYSGPGHRRLNRRTAWAWCRWTR